MSSFFINAKKNILYVINNAVLSEIKSQSLNKNLIKQNIKNLGISSPDINSNNTTNSLPNSLISTSLMLVNCGSNDCMSCISSNTNLDVNTMMKDYEKNIDKINKARNGVCKGLCNCTIQNVNLLKNLIFAVNTSIDGINDITTNNILKKAQDSISSMSKSVKTSSESPSPYWWLLGVGPGIIASSFPTKYDITINQDAKSFVKNMYESYRQHINQSIYSSQTMVLEGSGIEVKNVSLGSIQNVVLQSILSNCPNSTCNGDNLNNIADNIIGKINNQISDSISGMFLGAFNENKPLLIGAGVFISIIIIIYITSIFRKAIQKK